MSTTEIVPQQSRGQNALAKSSFPVLLDKFKGEIARALPRHLSADRMCRIALTEFRKNPKLADCDPRSVFAAIIVASQLGLEPGVLGQAYLIPYKTECQLIVGYQGLIDLVRRSGFVQRIEAHCVHENDKFTYRTGLTTVLDHEPALDGERGKLRLVYAVAEFKDGGYHVEVMTQDQVERIRDRSQAVISAKKYNKTTPWDTDTEEMWRKTVLRRICKFLPKSPEIAMAISLDDAAAQGHQNITVQDAVDNTWQAPILEVTTQDHRLAEKSADNLEELKARHADKADETTEQARAWNAEEREKAEARRQELRAQAERIKSGASQQPTQADETAGVAEVEPAELDDAPVEAGYADPPPEFLEDAPPERQPDPPSTPTASPQLDFGSGKKSRRS